MAQLMLDEEAKDYETYCRHDHSYFGLDFGLGEGKIEGGGVPVSVHLLQKLVFHFKTLLNRFSVNDNSN